MEIVSAIVQMLGGLAMFLYGIEVMGDGLGLFPRPLSMENGLRSW